MTIELNPLEEQIIEKHLREGRYPDAHAVITDALRLLEQGRPVPPEPDRASEALERMLAQLRSYAAKTPRLPVEAFDRESIYQDHDE